MEYHSNSLFIKLGLQQVESIRQQFALYSKKWKVLLLAFKSVEDIVFTNNERGMRTFIIKFNDKF